MNIDNPQIDLKFWEELNRIDFSNKQNLDKYLLQKWGVPINNNQINLFSELSKKIYSYYHEEIKENITIYSLISSVQDASDIIEKKFKEGKRMGQTYYVLKMGGEKIQVIKEDITPEKWSQIEKFAILGKEMVFRYKKWITNKQLLDFYPQKNKEGKKLVTNENPPQSSN